MKEFEKSNLSEIIESLSQKDESAPIKHKLLNRFVDWILIACCVFYYFFADDKNPAVAAVFIGTFIACIYRELYLI